MPIQRYSFRLLTALPLVASLAPTPASADPPAIEATCAGIRAAYPVLGTRCAKAHARIVHAPANAEERRSTYSARKAVLRIFRQALLCNGMRDAKERKQDAWKSGEDGHLQALDNLRQAMVAQGDPDVPAAYTLDDLKEISIRQRQCK